MRRAAVERSRFITLLGCIGFVYGAIGVFNGALQLVELASGLRPATPGDARLAMTMGSLFVLEPWQSTLHRYGVVDLLYGLVYAWMVVASIGLLLRRNRARLAMVVLLGWGIAANLVELAVMFAGLQAMAEAAPAFGGSSVLFLRTEFAFVAAHWLLYGWLIKRLSSPAVRGEFGADAPRAAVPNTAH